MTARPTTADIYEWCLYLEENWDGGSRFLAGQIAAALSALTADAERWHALMSSQRVRVIGSSGMVTPEGELKTPADGYVHIGVELWSLHGAPHPSAEFPQDRCREQLTFYVDFLRSRAPGAPT